MIKINTIQEYTELALRTEKIPDIYIESMVNNHDEGINKDMIRAVRLMHGIAGMITEIDELKAASTLQNKIEELGDMFWFMALLLEAAAVRGSGLTVNNQTVCKGDELRVLNEISTDIAALTDLVIRKHITYGKPLDINNVQLTVCHMLGLMMGLARYLDNPQNIMSANIEKLAKRFPAGTFDIGNYDNRDIENELSHIPVIPTTTIDISEPVALSKLQDFLKGNPSMAARWDIVKQVTIKVPGSFEVFIKGDTSETIREQRNILEELVLSLLGAESVDEANHVLGESFKRSSIRTYMEADWDNWKLRVFEYVPTPEEHSVLLPRDQYLRDLYKSRGLAPMHILKEGGKIFSILARHYEDCPVMADGFRTMYTKLLNTRTSEVDAKITDIWEGFKMLCLLEGVPPDVIHYEKLVINYNG